MLNTTQRQSMQRRMREIEKELEELALLGNEEDEGELEPTEREAALREELGELEATLNSDRVAERRRAGRSEGD